MRGNAEWANLKKKGKKTKRNIKKTKWSNFQNQIFTVYFIQVNDILPLITFFLMGIFLVTTLE